MISASQSCLHLALGCGVSPRGYSVAQLERPRFKDSVSWRESLGIPRVFLRGLWSPP